MGHGRIPELGRCRKVWLEDEKKGNYYKDQRQSGNQRNNAESFRYERSEETTPEAESKPVKEIKKLVAEDQDLVREQNVPCDCLHVHSTIEVPVSATKKKIGPESSDGGRNENRANYIAAEIVAEAPQIAALPLQHESSSKI